MGKFKSFLDKDKIILFKENKNPKKIKKLISLKESKDMYIIHYIDENIKKNIKIDKKSLRNYTFFEKTNNLYYKKYIKINDPSTIIQEMDSGDVGFGGFTTDHGATTGDNYAPGDARNLFGGSKQPPKMIRRPKIKDLINFTGEKKKRKTPKKKKLSSK